MNGNLSWLGCAVASCFAVGLLAPPGLNAQQRENPDQRRSTAELVKAAIEAETRGDDYRRHDLLREALQNDPNDPAARGYSGFVRFEDRWLPVDEIARQRAADSRLDEYCRLRDRLAGSLLSELTLARWCRDRELELEARFHWLRVVQFQPNHQEALKNLGVRWHNGRLLAPDEIRQAKAGRADALDRLRETRWARKRWQEHWSPLVTAWRRDVEQGKPDFEQSIEKELNAVQELGAEEASGALDVLNEMLQEGSASAKESQQESYRELALKYVDLLDPISEWWATQSLLRFAVEHPAPEVRTVAAQALGHRPWETYVPTLVASMQMPLEISFAMSLQANGGVSLQRSLFREGPEADHLIIHTQFAQLAPHVSQALYQPTDGSGTPQWARVEAAEAARASSRAGSGLAAQAARALHQTELANAQTLERNRRIHHALSQATGVGLDPDPRTWWGWWREKWCDYYEWEKPETAENTPKPVNQHASYQVCHVCFARGTKVYTQTGLVSIEEIRAGDHVLARDPESGELTYKPVLQATTSRPTQLLNVRVGDSTISTTLGHWFWVSGTGWRMAKQLEVGSRLQQVAGTVAIDRIETAPPPEPWMDATHNLIVDEFHTYFVADEKILVHDGTFFGRPMGWVPGLSGR